MPPPGGPSLTRPNPLLPEHDIDDFVCRHLSLDDWLKNRARKVEGRTSRIYVVCEENVVVGYYCLATGAVTRAAAPGKVRRNAPDPIPVAIIGRLAVAKHRERLGIGASMLQDALRRIVQISQSVGCAAILVHAIDQDASAFYAKHGFTEFPGGTKTLSLPIDTLRAAIA